MIKTQTGSLAWLGGDKTQVKYVFYLASSFRGVVLFNEGKCVQVTVCYIPVHALLL